MAFVLSTWQPPPPRTELVGDEVHLWRFPLVCSEPPEDLLDQRELQRARRLRIPGKAQAFIAARIRLRRILAGYLGRPPQSLRFEYGAAGKPRLAGDMAHAVAFNLAHSGEWGLCAVTNGFEVGVDIERVDMQLDFAKLAARFFSRNEWSRLEECAPPRRRRLFFRIWTRKEAWLKGRGGGFSEADQDLGPAHLAGCCTHDRNWWLRSFPVTRHYLAALAVPQEVSRVRRWDG